MTVLGDAVPELRAELEALADPDRAPAMAAYMRDQFVFLGVTSSDRKLAAKGFIAAAKGVPGDALMAAADVLWAQPEREFQYVACDLLHRRVHSLEEGSLPAIEHLIRSKSWWDTVDALAANVVGPVVRQHPALVPVMDAWIDDDDIWVARTAILHQLKYGATTDSERLFRYVDVRASDTEFFIRKACGWALRQYARHDAEAVRNFVDSRRDRLSGLTVREATKHL